MAINIRDIVPSDTISSMVDKINYNFDLLASNYGLQGIQGIQGIQGTLGLQGQTGLQGKKGAVWFFYNSNNAPDLSTFPEAVEGDMCYNNTGEAFELEFNSITQTLEWVSKGSLASIMTPPFMKSPQSNNVVYRENGMGGLVLSNDANINSAFQPSGITVGNDVIQDDNILVLKTPGGSIASIYLENLSAIDSAQGNIDFSLGIKNEIGNIKIQATNTSLLKLSTNGEIYISGLDNSDNKDYFIGTNNGTVKKLPWITSTYSLIPENPGLGNLGSPSNPIMNLDFSWKGHNNSHSIKFCSKSDASVSHNNGSLTFIDTYTGKDLIGLSSTSIVVGNGKFNDIANFAKLERNGDSKGKTRGGLIVSSKTDKAYNSGGAIITLVNDSYNIEKINVTVNNNNIDNGYIEQTVSLGSIPARGFIFEDDINGISSSLYGIGGLIRLCERNSNGFMTLGGTGGNRSDSDLALSIYGIETNAGNTKGGDVIISGGHNKSDINNDTDDKDQICLGGNVFIVGGSHVRTSNVNQNAAGSTNAFKIREFGNVIIGMNPVFSPQMGLQHVGIGGNNEGSLTPYGVKFFPTNSFVAHANEIIIDSDANARIYDYDKNKRNTVYYNPETIENITFNVNARNTIYHKQALEISAPERNSYALISGVLTDFCIVDTSSTPSTLIHTQLNRYPLVSDLIAANFTQSGSYYNIGQGGTYYFWVPTNSRPLLIIENMWQKNGGIVSGQIKMYRGRFVTVNSVNNDTKAYFEAVDITDSNNVITQQIEIETDAPIKINNKGIKSVCGMGFVTVNGANNNTTCIQNRIESPDGILLKPYPVSGAISSIKTQSAIQNFIIGEFNYSYHIYDVIEEDSRRNKFFRPNIPYSSNSNSPIQTGETGNGGNSSAV